MNQAAMSASAMCGAGRMNASGGMPAHVSKSCALRLVQVTLLALELGDELVAHQAALLVARDLRQLLGELRES